MAGFPLPGQTDFTAQEEQRMRQSQSDINSLSATANANKSSSPGDTTNAANREAGLNPVATGVGKALGGMVGKAFSGGDSSIPESAVSNMPTDI